MEEKSGEVIFFTKRKESVQSLLLPSTILNSLPVLAPGLRRMWMQRLELLPPSCEQCGESRDNCKRR